MTRVFTKEMKKKIYDNTFCCSMNRGIFTFSIKCLSKFIVLLNIRFENKNVFNQAGNNISRIDVNFKLEKFQGFSRVFFFLEIVNGFPFNC